MPQRDVKIERYSLHTYNRRHQISAGNVQQSRSRKITLFSEVLTHGIQTMVNLNFITNATTGNLGVVTTPNYFQHTVHAWLPIGEFDEIYDMIRNEAPIVTSYWADSNDPWDITTQSRSAGVRWVRVGTDLEPVGEGPADEEADPAAIIAMVAPDLELAS